MAKYKAGDKIIINIVEVEKDPPAGIPSYEIDPLEDGTQRYMTEKILDKIIDMGGDLYTCKSRVMSVDKNVLSEG